MQKANLTTTPMTPILVHPKLNVKLSFMSECELQTALNRNSAGATGHGQKSIFLRGIPEPFIEHASIQD
jgi:hypothetical protein